MKAKILNFGTCQNDNERAYLTTDSIILNRIVDGNEETSANLFITKNKLANVLCNKSSLWVADDIAEIVENANSYNFLLCVLGANIEFSEVHRSEETDGVIYVNYEISEITLSETGFARLIKCGDTEKKMTKEEILQKAKKLYEQQ